MAVACERHPLLAARGRGSRRLVEARHPSAGELIFNAETHASAGAADAAGRADYTNTGLWDPMHGHCRRLDCERFGVRVRAGYCAGCADALTPWPTAWDVDWDALAERRHAS